MSNKRICNKCGCEIQHTTFSLRFNFGYGSKHDMDEVEDITLCSKCIDDVADNFFQSCAINPLKEWDGNAYLE